MVAGVSHERDHRGNSGDLLRPRSLGLGKKETLMWEIQTSMFIAQSAIEKILPQLPAICDALGIDASYRDGHFHQDAADRSKVTVSVGEIHWGGFFILVFEHGVFKGYLEQHWGQDGDIYESFNPADSLKRAS
jgi:hypothetical protein